MRKLTLLLILACGGAFTGGVASAAAPRATQTNVIATPFSLPSSAYLTGVGHVWQTLNNCGPASLIAVLQHYGVQAPSQAALQKELKPNKFMTTGVIAPFLARYGLAAPIYRQGSIAHLRPLVASGIPVIILQYLNGPGSVPHFRVVRGYDDASQRVYMSDSIYGPNVYLSYQDFNALWSVYSNEFIPVLPNNLTSLLPTMLTGTPYRTAAP